MCRLIDADLLVKNCKCTGKFEDNFNCVTLSDLRRIIEEQPTAYDKDRVVEQLESLPRCSTWNHNSDNIDRNAAIEIVKRGGRDGH